MLKHNKALPFLVQNGAPQYNNNNYKALAITLNIGIDDEQTCRCILGAINGT